MPTPFPSTNAIRHVKLRDLPAKAGGTRRERTVGPDMAGSILDCPVNPGNDTGKVNLMKKCSH